MKTKRLFMLALILALVLAISIPMAVFADDPVVPFKATYKGIPVGRYDPACSCMHQTFEFDGQATHLGEGHMSATGKTDPLPPMPQDGGGTLIADNGDLLYWEYEGDCQRLPTGVIEFSGNYSITGGTGRFVGVTGTGRYWGSATPNVEGIIYLDGKLFK